MKIINLNDDIPPEALGTCLAIGSFDGIHKGHMQIIEQVKARARELGKKSAILTFEPHPISFFRPDIKNYRITDQKMRQQLLADNGVDFMFIADFDEDFSKITALDFVKNWLVGKLKVSEVFTGEDFIFGHERTGNARMLDDLSLKLGFRYNKIAKITDKNNERFSSTGIRKMILNERVDQVEPALGRNYRIRGTVIKGAEMGRKIGFRTANIDLGEFIIPKFGVYECRAHIDGETYNAIANIGIKPSIYEANKTNRPLLEVHIFNFDRDIYGKEIAVELLRFIREERKFSSVEELKKQIEKDVETIK